MHNDAKIYIANIWKLYFIKIARAAMFMMPIITLFFQERGLSMTEIMLLQSIFSVTIVLLEIPSGYLADLFERKTSIILAIIFAALGDFIYAFAYGFWSMLLAELVLALASSFMSGAYSALLYDSLKIAGKESEHKKYASRIFAMSKVSEALAAVSGAALAVAWSMASTFFLSAFLIILTLPLALSIKEPPRDKISRHSNHLKELVAIIKFAIHSNKRIKWLIIYGSTLSASTLVAVWMLQPYFKVIQIPVTYFGILWATLNLSGAFFALFAPILEEKLGLRKTLLLLASLPTIAHIVLANFNSIWVLVFIFFYFGAHGLSVPILQDYVNREIDSSKRASVLSVYSLFSRSAFVLLSPLVGYFADIYDLQTAFLASAIIFGTLTFISLPFLFKSQRE